MEGVVVREWQPYTSLEVSRTDKPGPPLSSELLIEVHAAGCNFFDVLMVEGKYQMKPPRPFIPGSEFAGVVVEAGEGNVVRGGTLVRGRWISDRQELRLVDRVLMRPQAAAFSMTYSTAYGALVFRANTQPGETVLIHAAAGGVGTAAIQIAKALGAKVIATAGSEEKLRVAQQEGADVVLNYTTDAWVGEVKAATGGRGVDVVVDPVGGDIFLKSTKVVAWDARVVVVGFTSGTIPKIATNRILLKNIAVTGLHWGQYLLHDPPKVVECFAAISRLYEAGKIKPVVMHAYPLARIRDALHALATRKTYGKVVLTIGAQSRL